MVVVYGISTGIILCLLLLTRNYKKRERLQYGGKIQPGDGLGLFLQNLFLKHRGQHEIFHKLSPDKDVVIENKIFYMHQIGSAVLILLLCMIIGFFYCISSMQQNKRQIEEIERPKEGEGEKRVSLEALYENKETEIIIPIEEYQLTEKELEERFKQVYEELQTTILGSNCSLQKVENGLDFSKDVIKGVQIQYYVGSSGVVQMDGSLNELEIYRLYEEHQVQELQERIVIALNYGNKQKEYELQITIKLPKQEKSLEEQIIEEINAANSVHKKRIQLPKKIANQKIIFKEKREEQSWFYLLMGIVAVLLVILSGKQDLKKRLVKRHQQLEQDYASMISKLTLLIGAGTTLLGAWERIIKDYENHKQQYGYRYVYEEMKITRKRMQNGISEADAYHEFGRRCDSTAYIKLGCLLEQNIRKGTKGLNDCLNHEVQEAFEKRKAIAKQSGEEASAKLLLPMMLMLVISMVVVLVPALLSMNI